MIAVTRLDGTPIVINVDLVQSVESTPDTVLTLTSGERVIVRESVDEVVRRAVAFKHRVASGPAPASADGGNAVE